MTTKMRLTITGSVAVVAFALAGCSGGTPAATPPAPTTAALTDAATPTAAGAASEAATPTAAGAASESASPTAASMLSSGIILPNRNSQVWVTPERLITPNGSPMTSITAWSPTGEQVWTHDAPFDMSEGIAQGAAIRVLDHTVAIIATQDSTGSGLEKSKKVVSLTLLNLADGSTVADLELPASGVSSHGLAFVLPSEPGAESNQVILVAEDGTKREIAADSTVNVVGGVPYWYGKTPRGNGLNDTVVMSENWNLKRLGTDPTFKVITTDDALGLLMVWNYDMTLMEAPKVQMIEASTGKTVYDVSCPDDARLGITGELDTASASSPNGKYAVFGPVIYSATEARCIGGGGQQSVSLTAVADDGTAYGTSQEGSVVIVPLNGEPQVLTSADASAPTAVLTGGVGVYRDEAIYSVRLGPLPTS